MRFRNEVGLRSVNGVLLLISFGLAAWMIHLIDWTALMRSWHDLSFLTLSLALLATAFSYTGLAGYDIIAVSRLRPVGISRRRACLVGATSFGISNFVGFPWIVGAAVRQRMYGARAVGLGALMTIVSSGWFAFWLVVVAVSGVVLVLTPAALGLPAAPPTLRLLGIILILAVIAVMLWTRQGRQLTVFRQRMEILPLRIMLAQMGAAVVDLLASGIVLYVLLPEGLAPGFLPFIGLFVVAVGLGVLSHLPAGIGSFEAVMVMGIGGTLSGDLVASLVLYRALRTVLPFAIASAVLAGTVWSQQGGGTALS